jgi:hypothetical protein
MVEHVTVQLLLWVSVFIGTVQILTEGHELQRKGWPGNAFAGRE